MRVLDLALKDLLQLARDWKSALFLLVMPIIFTLMFGFAFGGLSSDQDPRLQVGVLNLDGDGLLSAGWLELLDQSEVVRPVPWEEDLDNLEREVQNEDLPAGVVIPAGYSERMLRGETVPLGLIVDSASTGGGSAQNEVQVATNRLSGAVQTAQLSAQLYAESQGFADHAARQAYLEQSLQRAIAAWEHPPIAVIETDSQPLAGEEHEAGLENAFAHSSPSMIVQFAIAGLIGAANVLFLERKSRALQRLLTTAISRSQIILGHYLAMLVMILAQVLVLAIFGQLFLRLDYFGQPGAMLLITTTMALWTAALGLLIGVLAKSEEHVIIFSLISMFVLAGLGGGWMPLEYTPQSFQTVGHLMPTAWAIDGFKNILVRGQGLNAALLPAGIMLGYAAAIFAVAAWRFRFE